VTEFVINLETDNSKIAQILRPHFYFLKDFFFSPSEDTDIASHIDSILSLMKSHKKYFPAEVVRTFQGCADQVPLFVVLKTVAVVLDRLKVLFLKAFDGTIPSEFLSGNFRPNETIATALMAFGRMNDEELVSTYPVNARREEHLKRAKTYAQTPDSKVVFDFESVMKAMRENLNTELDTFGEQLREGFREYYATKPAGPIVNRQKLLNQLDIQFAEEKEALELQLTADLDKEVRTLRRSIQTEKVTLEEELADLSRQAEEAQTQTPKAQRKRLAKETAAHAQRQQELEALQTEISQCKENAQQRYTRLDRLVGTLRNHIVAEMNVVVRLGEGRGVAVAPALTYEEVSEKISEGAARELCGGLEDDWRKLLEPPKSRRQKSRRAPA
jgi:hypothetical protein